MRLRRPPHLYLDHTWYMVTAATYQRLPHMISGQHAQKLTDTLQVLAIEHQILIGAWVVLPDHYHLLLKPQNGRMIAKFVQRLHSITSRQFNLWDATPGRSIWHNYWDTCIRSEAGYWTRFNYIHYNPVKHGYVDTPAQWEYSSYCFYLKQHGLEWLTDIVASYPVRAAEIAESDSEAD